ncbi:MAG TPA: paraquat-inducible protein A [Gammaproteobacteria bacterium]|nr:paraquat-inducible protein A [Gammaproteobacteria bacterium]
MSIPEIPIVAGSEITACHECDALHRVPELAPGAAARCHVCGALLVRNPKGGLDRPIALYSTALILLLLANIFPFLTLEIGGRQEITTLFGASQAMYNAGMGELAVVVFLTSILAPALMMTSSLYVLLAVRFRKSLPGVRVLLSWIGHLEPWVMLDVFMLGVLVAFVKLGNMATMYTGNSLYAFMGLIVVFAAASSSFDTHLLWHKLGIPGRKT